MPKRLPVTFLFEPREKIMLCTCTVSATSCQLGEAILVRTYMRKNSLTKPIHRLAQVIDHQSKITSLRYL